MSTEVVVTSDLEADIADLEAKGFRLDVIFPADAPRIAELSRGEEIIRFEARLAAPDLGTGDTTVLTRGGDWGTGRAGMRYRDLIPDRRGGRFIASHIRIDEPGPVPDYVHHHAIDFQMIFCRRGRVQVVYEDQGPPFWMEPGDCVLQPPHIRHRVLASDGGCEVVEIASPAEHPTHRDHDLELPTLALDLHRDFGGQRFSFDRAAASTWDEIGGDWVERSTGIADATAGAATVRAIRAPREAAPFTGTHADGLLLFYVLEGAAEIEVDDETMALDVDDSLAMGVGARWSVAPIGAGVELLVIDVDTEAQ